MDEATAFSIAREWLRIAQESDEKVPMIAGPLERGVPQPAAHATATDGRLALLTDNTDLYVVTVDFAQAEFVGVRIERIDLSAAGAVRLTYTETHESKVGAVVFTWRVDFEIEREPLEFQGQGRYQRGELRPRDSDAPAIAFGWQVAEATGWAPQGPEEPFVEVPQP
jgi:hypothetical protein